jgi:hypothetical protein
MRRREFIAYIGGLTVWPLVARAQRTERVRRIGILMPFPVSDTEFQARVRAFREELARLGWSEGRMLNSTSAAAGGLVSYGPDRMAMFRESASYVDRILRGEKAGELPFQQPTAYRLVINPKAITTMGMTVPPALLAVADEVIE